MSDQTDASAALQLQSSVWSQLKCYNTGNVCLIRYSLTGETKLLLQCLHPVTQDSSN